METPRLGKLPGRGELRYWLGWQENIGTMTRSDCQEAVGRRVEGKDARVLTAIHMGVRAPTPPPPHLPSLPGLHSEVLWDEQWEP